MIEIHGDPTVWRKRTPPGSDNLPGMEKFFCFRCRNEKERREFHERSQHGRPVAYHCKECRKLRNRSKETWQRAFKKYGEICSSCDWPRPLADGSRCSACLKENGLKKCIRCGDVKPLYLCFYEKQGVCIECTKKKHSYKMRPQRASPPKDPDKARNAYLVRKYGLTYDQYKVLLKAQDGRCGICRNPPEENRLLVVDHCHVTGRVRGLLCHRCNVGIGMLQDSKVVLVAAMAYLEQPPATQ